MLERDFIRAGIIAQLEQGPLGPYLEELTTTLYQQDYTRSTIQLSVRAGDKFGRWLHQQSLTPMCRCIHSTTIDLDGAMASHIGNHKTCVASATSS